MKPELTEYEKKYNETHALTAQQRSLIAQKLSEHFCGTAPADYKVRPLTNEFGAAIAESAHSRYLVGLTKTKRPHFCNGALYVNRTSLKDLNGALYACTTSLKDLICKG